MSEKKVQKKQVKLPTKQTLNLLIKEKTLASPSRLIPILILIIGGAYLFSRYAVVARLEKVNREEAELAEMKSNLSLIQNAFTDYDEVQQEYNRYSYSSFDKTIPDRVEVLEMLENRLFPICSIQSLTINGRDLNMVIAGIDMATLTYINGMLSNDEPLVESVEISSYVDNTDRENSDRSTVTATISIRLADASASYSPDQLEFDPDAIIEEGSRPEDTPPEPADEPAPAPEPTAPETAPEGELETAPEAGTEQTDAPAADDGVTENGGVE